MRETQWNFSQHSFAAWEEAHDVIFMVEKLCNEMLSFSNEE